MSATSCAMECALANLDGMLSSLDGMLDGISELRSDLEVKVARMPPSRHRQAERRHAVNMSIEKQCPICWEEFSDAASTIELECGHRLCKRCRNTWAEQEQHKGAYDVPCPCCRTTFSMHPVLVEENVDYEPTEEELTQYGEAIGMTFPEDDSLRWLCREGLRTPMPKQWKCYRSLKTDEVFYWNEETNEAQWDYPSDEAIRARYRAEKKALKRAAAPSHRTAARPRARPS